MPSCLLSSFFLRLKLIGSEMFHTCKWWQSHIPAPQTERLLTVFALIQVQGYQGADQDSQPKKIERPAKSLHACVECKRRKIRCNGRQPCLPCQSRRSQTHCVYDQPRQRLVLSRKSVAVTLRSSQVCVLTGRSKKELLTTFLKDLTIIAQSYHASIPITTSLHSSPSHGKS